MVAPSIAFALAAVVAFGLTPPVGRLAARTGAIARPDDQPSGRHIHKTPTPRLGGLAIFAGFTVAVTVTALIAQTPTGIICSNFGAERSLS